MKTDIIALLTPQVNCIINSLDNHLPIPTNGNCNTPLIQPTSSPAPIPTPTYTPSRSKSADRCSSSLYKIYLDQGLKEINSDTLTVDGTCASTTITLNKVSMTSIEAYKNQLTATGNGILTLGNPNAVGTCSSAISGSASGCTQQSQQTLQTSAQTLVATYTQFASCEISRRASAAGGGSSSSSSDTVSGLQTFLYNSWYQQCNAVWDNTHARFGCAWDLPNYPATTVTLISDRIEHCIRDQVNNCYNQIGSSDQCDANYLNQFNGNTTPGTLDATHDTGNSVSSALSSASNAESKKYGDAWGICMGIMMLAYIWMLIGAPAAAAVTCGAQL